MVSFASTSGNALRRARGVKSAAAEALGISRPTLDRKIEEYGIDLFAGKDEAP